MSAERRHGGEGGRGAERRVARAASGAAIVAVALAGCGTNPFGVSQSELERHRDRWIAAGLDDYSFSYRRTCECPPALASATRIEVRDGVVTRVTYDADGEQAAPAIAERFPTIDDLFDTIDDAISQRAASLTVSYDNALGYPTEISIDYDTSVADDEVGMYASSVASLEQ